MTDELNCAGPRMLTLDSWQRVRGLAEQWIAAGALRQAFRLVLAFRLGQATPESAAFMRRQFREAPLRIAVAMVQGIGNMVMLTPAVRALKELYPHAEIEVVGHYPALEVVEGWELVAACTELEHFDPSPQRDVLLLSIWSGQFQKAQSELVGSGEAPAVEVKFWDHKRHESEFHLDLARTLGYEGPMPAPHCERRPGEWPFAPGRPVALVSDTAHPDPQWQRKRWPHWPELTRRLTERGFQVGLIGGSLEAEQFNPGDWPAGVVNLLGRCSIPESAEVIRRAGLLIANDSGPAHVAGAVGARTYVLFGPTLEAKNLPGGPAVRVIAADLGCRPCQYLPSWDECERHRCMELITADRVIEEVFGERKEREPAPPAPPARPARREVKVDLGCGRYKRRGHVGIDIDPESAADVVCDLRDGIPLATDSVDELVADNLLEHVGEGFVELMNEIWRACKPGATVEIIVPLFPGQKAVSDPTHRRYFTEESVGYLDGASSTWRLYGASYGFRPFRVLWARKLAGELELLLSPDKETPMPARARRGGSRPRLCLFSHNQPGAGGAERALHEVANRLVEAGCEVSAVHNETPFIHARPVEPLPGTRYRLAWVRGADLEAYHRAAARELTERAGQTDLCLSLWRATSPELIGACRAAAVPHGIWCQNVQYPPERGNNSIFRLADFVVGVTPFVRYVLAQRFSRTEEVYVIPNAAGDAFFDAFVDRTGRELRRFVFFGRLADEQKGLGTLCNALPLVRKHVPDFRLDVVGDGPDADAMRSKIGSLGLGEHVRMLGWLGAEELAPRLADYDLCILPSNFEGCSLALLEAMAAGLPLITTGVGGNPWVVKDKKHGLVIAPARPKLLAQAVNWACDHPDEMNLMGRWARKKALKRYHWGRVVSDFVRLFERVLDARTGAPGARRAG